MRIVLPGYGPVLLQGLLFCLASAGLCAVDRAVTMGGVEAVRNMRYSSVIELVRFELKLGRPESARRKLRYHLEQVPGDSEALELLGDLLLQDGDRAEALTVYEKAAALKRNSARQKAEALTRTIEADRKSILEDNPFRTILRPIEPPKPEKAVVQGKVLKKGGPLQLSLLRTLNSLLERYISVKGSDAGFSLESLKASGILTQNLDFSALGKLTVVNKRVSSESYGTHEEQKQMQKVLLDAYSMAAAGNCTGALKGLMALSGPDVHELNASLQFARRCGSASEVQQLESALALRGEGEPEVMLRLAEEAWAKQDLVNARKWYQKLLNTQYANTASLRLQVMESGGNAKLESILRQQLKDIGRAEANP